MLLHIIARGKIGRSPEADLVDRYMKRLTMPCRITELPDRGGKLPPAAPGTVTVMLDEKGRQLASMDFARRIEGWRDGGTRECRFLIGAAEACGSGVFIFFVERTLSLGHAAGGLLMVQFLVGLVTVPAWAMVSKRLGKRRALIAVLTWQLLTAPLPLFLPSGQAAPLLGYLVLRACAWGADYMLLRAMVADVSAADTARTGQTRASSYYALFNVSLKLAGGLGVGFALWLLARGGFDPKVMATTADTALQIRIVYAMPALIAPALGLLLMATARSEPAPKPLLAS